jgi:hypothetical protein
MTPGHPVPLAVELTGTTNSRLLAQTRAVLVHESFFTVYMVQPWTTMLVRSGERKSQAWVVPISRRLLVNAGHEPWSRTAWLSLDLARTLKLKSGAHIPLTIETTTATLRVQPARIDNYLNSDRIVVSKQARRVFGRMLLVSSGSRVAVMRTTRRHSKQQADSSVRMNFHVRRLLGVVPEPVTNTQHVQISTFHPVEASNDGIDVLWLVPRFIARLVSGLLEEIGRLALRAPSVTLANEESLTSDDPHGVARIPSNVADLLGVSAGDSIYVYWGRRRVRLRVLLLDSSTVAELPLQGVVDWMPNTRAAQPDPQSKICLPAKVRVALGMPRNGVPVVRRSVLSTVRRRMISLTLPVVAITVSISRLGLQPLQAILLLAVVLVLTLAGDRIPRHPWFH